ncbi:MAG TPA: beta-ketoacyl-ACP reductase [Desulfotomaculum sp.]|nr:beta-ketoacyl-ACP reductase [Desulfotomaculum sp.]
MGVKVKDRVALITGSGSGIGEGVAKRLSQNGAKIVINDVVQDKIDRVVEEIKVAGGEAIGMNIDITKKDQVDEMFKKTVETFGRIDILVNNAGVSRDKGILKLTEADWDFVVDINLKGQFFCCQGAIGYMREQKFGRIVNISSRAWLGGVGQANYAASKGGVVSLTRTLALELARFGINVNCICPGLIKTPLYDALTEEQIANLVKAQPMGAIGNPSDIAQGVLFFVDDDAGYVTGQVIFICGGRSLWSSLSV